MLIRNAGVGELVCDVRIAGGRIADIAATLVADHEEMTIDAAGGALLPGLHDHHIHLNAAAAAMASLHCGPPDIVTARDLAAALAAFPGAGWIRGFGYHESVAGDVDRAWLDLHGPARPVRIQHRSGRLWIMNSAALDLLHGEAPSDGRLFDADGALVKRIGAPPPDLQPLTARLLSYGVTGVTDATPRNKMSDLERYRREAAPLDIVTMGDASMDDRHRDDPGVGPRKFHYHDHDLPALDDFAAEIAVAHAHGRPVAVHCVTRAELLLALAAIELAGRRRGDRIEHAAVAPDDAVDWIAQLGVTVVTQPHFLAERGAAYAQDVDPDDRPFLWRVGAFTKAGVQLAAGSDAPFGGLNPWRAMAVAVKRPDGFGDDASVGPETALGLYTSPARAPGDPPRKIERGALADLCLLTTSWADAVRDLSSVSVAATFVDGRIVYSSIASIRPQESASYARSRRIDNAR